MSAVPVWIEVLVSALLLISGVLSLIGALGLVRLKDFFQRMHPPALANTCGAWCITLASIVYFSALQERLTLYASVINILVAVTAPLTTALLARAALFRSRQKGEGVPSPLGNDVDLSAR
jgi:multicomponent K+:H+ antiporter subunit G